MSWAKPMPKEEVSPEARFTRDEGLRLSEQHGIWSSSAHYIIFPFYRLVLFFSLRATSCQFSGIPRAPLSWSTVASWYYWKGFSSSCDLACGKRTTSQWSFTVASLEVYWYRWGWLYYIICSACGHLALRARATACQVTKSSAMPRQLRIDIITRHRIPICNVMSFWLLSHLHITSSELRRLMFRLLH
jgi:hypothetical protein